MIHKMKPLISHSFLRYPSLVISIKSYLFPEIFRSAARKDVDCVRQKIQCSFGDLISKCEQINSYLENRGFFIDVSMGKLAFAWGFVQIF